MEKTWYIVDPKLNEAAGPYSTDDILKLLKSEKLRLDDFIFSNHFDTNKWVRIFECEEFKSTLARYPLCAPPRFFKSKEKREQEIQKLIISEKAGDYGIENIYRRYPRIPIEAGVVVHDGNTVHFGKSKDVSERGTFVLLDSKCSFKDGHEVKVTMRNLPNSIGTISMSAAIIKQTQENGEIGLALFFFKISPKVRRQLANLVLKQLSQDGAQAG